MKIYQVTFEDYRDTSNIVDEIQYILADCLESACKEVEFEGDGYDKELVCIKEVIPAVRTAKTEREC